MKMKIIHSLVGFVIVIASITSANADPATKVHVTIRSDCKVPVPADAYVVLNGKEHLRIPVKKQDGYWEGSTVTGYSYDAKKSRASLRGIHRGGGGRTRCEPSTAHYDGDQNTAIGYFDFNCSDVATEEVEVRLAPPTMWIGYTRSLNDPPCVDWAFYDDGIHNIDALWPNETVRIHFGSSQKDHDAPGLLLLVPDPKTAERLVFNEIAARHVKNHEINFKGLVQALIEQRGRGAASGPGVSSNGIDSEIEQLRRDGFRKLTITGVK